MRYLLLCLLTLSFLLCCSGSEYRSITVDDYLNKMKAGWIGQMAGVGWGAPTEFHWNGKIVPEDNVPEWTPDMVNQFNQDDIYVEMTFLRTLEQYGLDVSIRQAGIDFANSRYMLWHANKAGRENLRAGIAPPYSGHPKFNDHADDIDYQIEADYAGLISPGLPQSCIDLGEKFGRLMNYGDGLYGGQFVAAMYAEAFFETDMENIIRAGLSCIPANSQYHECISDVLDWFHQNPEDWTKTWQMIEDKYQDNPQYRRFSCGGPDSDFNIDAKINGAYIVMGLLYGKGDLDRTIAISMRCGQDSDCNPSNAAGILAATMGYDKLPEKFKTALDMETRFSYTDYNFTELLGICEQLARQLVVKYGGSIEKAGGKECFRIPVQTPEPGALEQCWEAGDMTGNTSFTESEMQKIEIRSRKPGEFIQHWQVSGPYTMASRGGNELLDIVFPPEQYKGKWKTITLGEDGLSSTNVQLHSIYGGEERAAYARTRFYSGDAIPAVMELGSDDGVKVWLNGRLIHQNDIHRACNPQDDIIKLNIIKGWNVLLFKVTQGGGGWELTACLTNEQGNALKDLKFEF